MNIEARLAFLDWCRRERDGNQRILDLFTAGTMRTGKNDGSGWQDTTDESIANSQRIISDMNDLIAKIEAGDA